uniref:histidine kinase n=2 Tax=Paracidobacterium acidisoli TaxID=2303751 RepID=A0A372IQ11_9BACT
MRGLMRVFDWAKTPLGPAETWSPTLRAMTQMLLANCFPMLLWWGPDFYQLYNDAWSPVLGDRPPHAGLGRPFRECRPEIFHILGPLARKPFEGGPPTWIEDILLEVNRFGFQEEAHFTMGYSPVPDDTAPKGIGGVLATVHEITRKVVGDRRVSALRDLSAQSFEPKTAEEACGMAAAVLSRYPRDISFALIYLTESNGRYARLAGRTGMDGHEALGPEVVEILGDAQKSWPFSTVLEQKTLSVVDDLGGRFGRVPGGPWSDPPHTAVMLPIRATMGNLPAGFLIAGISPRLRFDDSYRGFLELLSAQISTSIAHARAYEEERRHAEALNEPDLADAGVSLTLSRLRREAEMQVRESEERFRALVAASSDVIYRMNADWSEMQQLRGRDFIPDTREPSRTWLEKYILPEDQARVMAAIQEAVRTKTPFQLEHRVVRVDGSPGWTLSRAVPLLNDDGELLEWLGSASDVTIRRENEQSRLRLASIVDSADDAIISKDLNGIVQSWNEGAVRMFGYSPEEMTGESILRLIPEDLQFEEDEILCKLRSGERIDHYETRRRKKNGETIEVSITVSPIRDETGRVTGASKIARDISDRRRVERLLIQSEKLAATGRMAAAIAHEINNPLESLMNLIYLARQSDSQSTVAGYLRTAEEELERVSHIARQTLGYYRDTGLPTELYLHDLIGNVLTVYNSRIVGAGIAVETQLNDFQKILASKGELLQVFSNIVANSIDAMGQGGTLSVTARKVLGSSGDGMQVVLRDTGTGIPAESLPKIFEPFFTTKGNLGTGIGLWVAKQLIEKRGGRISVTSSTEKGRSGTMTAIFLPFASPQAHAGPAQDEEISRQ